MRKLITISCCFLFFLAGISAQTIQPRQMSTQNKGVIYNKEVAFDFRLHTNGFATGLTFGKIRTYYHTRYYTIEFGEIKHPKEFRLSFDNLNINGKTAKSFIFGKQNSFFTLRGGYGAKRYFTEKAARKGLAVGMSYSFGPTVGILKPYYLELRRNIDNENKSVPEKYSPENEDVFLNQSNIYGASAFSKGIDELSFRPGAYGKVGVHLDWGAFDEFIKAVDVGIMIDGYLTKVPIMVETDSFDTENSRLFINLYISLHLGKRR